MVEAPIPATRKLLAEAGLSIDDSDLTKIHEVGHPLGGTGSSLATKAVHELHRSGGRHASVTTCCVGGLGTGTSLERA